MSEKTVLNCKVSTLVPVYLSTAFILVMCIDSFDEREATYLTWKWSDD